MTVEECDRGGSRHYLFINHYRAAGQGKEKGVGASFRLVLVNTGSWSFLQVGACKLGSWCSHPIGAGELNVIIM